MNRKFAAGLVGLAFLVPACGSGTAEPAPVKTVFVERDSQESQESNASKDQRYLEVVADNMSPALHNEAQSDVLDLGYTVCEATEDHGAEAVANRGLDAGYLSPEDFGVIVGAAVTILCPEHQDEWSNFFETVGGTDV